MPELALFVDLFRYQTNALGIFQEGYAKGFAFTLSQLDADVV